MLSFKEIYSQICESEYDNIMAAQRMKEGGLRAALRDPHDNSIHTGKTHSDAFHKAPKEVQDRLRPYAQGGNFYRTGRAGFVDVDNNWISRHQAREIIGDHLNGGHAEGLHKLGYMK